VVDSNQAGTQPFQNEAQQIVSELNAARTANAMWQTAAPPQFQTQAQMTGGLEPDMSSGSNTALQMMMQQQAFQTQQMLNQQTSLRAYAQGLPGYASPATYMQNPVVANYQMQNMYQLNPYMANFLGGQGGAGAPGMNLAPAQMMTSARLGMFRGMQQGQDPQAMGLSNVLRDLATLYLPNFRAFAPYEDVVDETIESGRRMYRRKESLYAGLGSVGAMGLGFMPGLGLAGGLAVGLGAPVAAELVANAYFQRRAETNQIYDISQRIATAGGGANGFRNIGFGLGESAGMMREFRREAAQSPFFSMSDYMQVLESGTDAGMMKFVGTAGQTTKKVKEYVEMLDVFMQLAGDPDVRSAMERMGNLQNLGIAPGQMQNAMSNIKTYSRLMGTSVDDFMSTQGAMGAQLAAQQGGLAGYGMMTAGIAGAGIRGLVQRGLMSQAEVAIRGGESGMAQAVTQGMLGNTQAYLEQNVAAFMGRGGQLDMGAFQKFLETGQTPGGQNFLVQSTANNLSGMTTNQKFGYMRDHKDHLAALQEKLTQDPTLQLMLERRRIDELAEMQGISRKDVLYQQYGEQWRSLDFVLSDQNMLSNAVQKAQQQRSINARRRTRYLRQNSFLNSMGTGIAEMFNNMMENFFDFEQIARKEQFLSARAAGLPAILSQGWGGMSNDELETLAGLDEEMVTVPNPKDVLNNRHLMDMYQKNLKMRRGFGPHNWRIDESERRGKVNDPREALKFQQSMEDTNTLINRGRRMDPSDVRSDSAEANIDLMFFKKGDGTYVLNPMALEKMTEKMSPEERSRRMESISEMFSYIETQANSETLSPEDREKFQKINYAIEEFQQEREDSILGTTQEQVTQAENKLRRLKSSGKFSQGSIDLAVDFGTLVTKNVRGAPEKKQVYKAMQQLAKVAGKNKLKDAFVDGTKYRQGLEGIAAKLGLDVSDTKVLRDLDNLGKRLAQDKSFQENGEVSLDKIAEVMDSAIAAGAGKVLADKRTQEMLLSPQYSMFSTQKEREFGAARSLALTSFAKTGDYGKLSEAFSDPEKYVKGNREEVKKEAEKLSVRQLQEERNFQDNMDRHSGLSQSQYARGSMNALINIQSVLQRMERKGSSIGEGEGTA